MAMDKPATERTGALDHAALFFMLVATSFGIWITRSSWIFWTETELMMPRMSAVVAGLFLWAGLTKRGYLPRIQRAFTGGLSLVRKCFAFLVPCFWCCLVAMHLLGTGIDMMLTVFAVCAAVLVFGEQRYSLLAACGIALLFAIKVWLLDVSFDWRAFGFGAASFLSLVFWSPSFQEGFLGLTDHLVPGRPDQAR